MSYIFIERGVRMNTYSMDKMYESYSSEVERMQKCIDELLQENQQLKNNINKLQKELNEENLQCSKYSIELNNLKQENKILKENAEHNDKVVDKVNWENMLLKGENKQLKDNWNKLREWIVYNKHNENTEQHYLVVDYGTLLGKMKELEQESDE